MAAEPQGVECWVDLEVMDEYHDFGQFPGTPCNKAALTVLEGGTVQPGGTGKEGGTVQAFGTMETERKNPRKALCSANQRILRVKAGLTQDDVAAHMGVGREHVSHWENGREPLGKPIAGSPTRTACTLEDFYRPLNGDHGAP